jgi:hypothetical protein
VFSDKKEGKTMRCHHRIRTMKLTLSVSALIVLSGFAPMTFGQTNPLNLFKNYFVTGDYLVAGWVEQSSANRNGAYEVSLSDSGVGGPPVFAQNGDRTI